MCKHSISFYTTTSNFYTFLFTRPHRSYTISFSFIIHFILHLFVNMQSACTLLRLGEVHASNVYVVVVGAMPSCCICLCVLKYQSIPFFFVDPPTDVVFFVHFHRFIANRLHRLSFLSCPSWLLLWLVDPLGRVRFRSRKLLQCHH